MTQDRRPPVPPIEGHYGLLPCGTVVKPVLMDESNPPYFYDVETDFSWDTNGKFLQDSPFQHDITATCPFDLIFACFDGRLGALVNASNSLLDTIEAYHSENLVLMAHHPRVHEVSQALTAMMAIKP